MNSNFEKRGKQNTPFKLTDHNQAERLFEKYKSEDPFPDIPAALLNSADVYDYAVLTGMICPFDSEGLKSASYEVKLQGEVTYWDENGERQVKQINNEDDTFDLRPNSIAFVNLATKFRLPDYIALRFNLKIKHVHRGLLLGTGPLIDPGYQGQLLIPLHNLTTNKYTFRGGEGLIWIEFTKLSPNTRWTRWSIGWNLNQHLGKYEPFEFRKQNQPSGYFLSQAADQRPIRSSIPFAIQKAQQSAADAEESAKEAVSQIKGIERVITIGGIVAVVTLTVGLLTLAFQVYSMVSDGTNLVRETRKDLEALQGKINSLPKQNRNKPILDAVADANSLAKEAVETTQKTSVRVDRLVLLMLLCTSTLLAFLVFYLIANHKNSKYQLNVLKEEIKDIKKGINKNDS